MIDPKDPYKKMREDRKTLIARKKLADANRFRDKRETETVQITERVRDGEGFREEVRDVIRLRPINDAVVIRAGLVGAIKPKRSLKVRHV